MVRRPRPTPPNRSGLRRGLVALGIVAYHGYRGHYDHEEHAGVRNCVLYWHFLDVVWLVMFGTFLAVG